jgi:molybdenum cofactor cytidylyltransferase
MKSGTMPELCIVILAAGFSARLGRCKPLVRVHGVSLLHRALAATGRFAASRIVVVTPPHAGAFRTGLPCRPIRFVGNAARAAGLSSSVRLGLEHARWSAGALLLPVDLARLTRRDVARLIARWRGARRHVVARRLGQRAATPLVLPRWLHGRAAELRGDQGLRAVVGRVPTGLVTLVAMASAESDVDTPADLERARRHAAGPYTRGVCTSR